MKSKALGWTVAGAAVLLVGSQLFPVDTSNPPADGPMAIPEGEVGQILRDACMDCHSHETVWPWYAHVTPVKFLLADHVSEGRGKLNFSTWGGAAPSRQARKLEEIAELVQEGEMPLATYSWMHPAARLTDAERQAIVEWAQAERARMVASGAVPANGRGEGTARGGEEAGEREESGERGEAGQR